MRAAVAVVAVAGLLVIGGGTAAASDGQPVSTMVIDGTLGTAVTDHASGEQRGTDPYGASGYNSARGVGAAQIAYQQGRIVCLDVRGSTAGFITRITKTAAPGLVGTDVYATLIDGGPGGVDRGGFLLNVPAGSLRGCAPQPALARLPFTSGGVVVTDGKR